MTSVSPTPRRAPSHRAVAVSALAVAAASVAIGAGGWSGLGELKRETQAVIGAAASRSKALLTHGRIAASPLPRGSLSAASPAEPFVLKAANTHERERALRCLANAVYYEAATEPVEGQRAVAQVVLNRVRDPNFPKSICGVVYQGWERQTGCQFSFTCDGSLLRGAPNAALMANARSVADEALRGHVEPQVGTATHYHADYVSPWWRYSVTKVAQIGAHIFYRWPGAAGAIGAFTGQYRGGETRLSEAVLSGRAPRPVQVDASPDPTVMALKRIVVADDSAPGGVRTRIRATLMFGSGQATAPAAQPTINGARPQPTPEQVAQLNALIDKRFPEAAAHSAPAPAAEKATVAATAATVTPPSAPVAATPAPKLEAVSTAGTPVASAAPDRPVAGG